MTFAPTKTPSTSGRATTVPAASLAASPGAFLPNERISLAQVIEAYTLGAAYAGRREKTEGSLEPGKVADLIVVSQNLFEIDPRAIRATKVLLTMVGGNTVYQAEDWQPSKN